MFSKNAKQIQRIGFLFNKKIRNYDAKVMKHFENPKNTGSFDKNDPNVGTGLVGAPSCIHENTLIAVADGRRVVSVKNLYYENKIIPVWSYNIEKKIYEIKNARIIKQKIKKKMRKIVFDDNTYLICTDDHKFLLKDNTYKENKLIDKNESLVPFKRYLSKNGYWETFVQECNDYNHRIIFVEELDDLYDCYDLEVEENNNFAVVTDVTKNIQNGIILKNCGDVLKLQIKVDPNSNEIIDTCFKTYGCTSAIASSSYGTEIIKNKTLDEAEKITNKDIANELNLPPVKIHCSVLSEEAVKMAIADYKSKQ